MSRDPFTRSAFARAAVVRLGWAALDEVARGMLGMAPVDEKIPLRLFTQENLKDISNDENELFGGDFVAEYNKLWGLQ